MVVKEEKAEVVEEKKDKEEQEKKIKRDLESLSSAISTTESTIPENLSSSEMGGRQHATARVAEQGSKSELITEMRTEESNTVTKGEFDVLSNKNSTLHHQTTTATARGLNAEKEELRRREQLEEEDEEAELQKKRSSLASDRLARIQSQIQSKSAEKLKREEEELQRKHQQERMLQERRDREKEALLHHEEDAGITIERLDIELTAVLKALYEAKEDARRCMIDKEQLEMQYRNALQLGNIEQSEEEIQEWMAADEEMQMLDKLIQRKTMKKERIRKEATEKQAAIFLEKEKMNAAKLKMKWLERLDINLSFAEEWNDIFLEELEEEDAIPSETEAEDPVVSHSEPEYSKFNISARYDIGDARKEELEKQKRRMVEEKRKKEQEQSMIPKRSAMDIFHGRPLTSSASTSNSIGSLVTKVKQKTKKELEKEKEEEEAAHWRRIAANAVPLGIPKQPQARNISKKKDPLHQPPIMSSASEDESGDDSERSGRSKPQEKIKGLKGSNQFKRKLPPNSKEQVKANEPSIEPSGAKATKTRADKAVMETV